MVGAYARKNSALTIILLAELYERLTKPLTEFACAMANLYLVCILPDTAFVATYCQGYDVHREHMPHV